MATKAIIVHLPLDMLDLADTSSLDDGDQTISNMESSHVVKPLL